MKKSSTLAIILFSLLSCEYKSNKKSDILSEQRTETMNTENVELIKAYFEHFNNHDWKRMAEMYTETADFKDPSLGQGIVKQTRQETIAKYEQLNAIFPNLHDEIVQIYPSGNEHI